MAVITTLADSTVLQVNTQVSSRRLVLPFPASGISNGDNVQVHAFPRLGKLSEVIVTTDGSLGAGATVVAQLNRNGSRTTLTTATTAAAASQGTSYSIKEVPIAILAGDILELLVGGANVTAAANVTVDYLSSLR